MALFPRGESLMTQEPSGSVDYYGSGDAVRCRFRHVDVSLLSPHHLMLEVNKLFLWRFSRNRIYGAQNINTSLFASNWIPNNFVRRWVPVSEFPCRACVYVYKDGTEVFWVGHGWPPTLSPPLQCRNAGNRTLSLPPFTIKTIKLITNISFCSNGLSLQHTK